MRYLLISLILISCLFSIGQNNTSDKRKKHFNVSAMHLALEGYDVVCYFAANPKKGNKNFYANQNGISYYFLSQANLDLFKGSTEKYAPTYGGWCA